MQYIVVLRPVGVYSRCFKNPGDGGLALPDWRKYYLASQLVFAHRWLTSDAGDSATVVEVAHLGSNETLRLAIHRGAISDLPLTLSMKATVKAWDEVVELSCPSYFGFSPQTPLWGNPKLPNFYSFSDPMVWVIKGIKLLTDITRDGVHLTFD